MHVRNKLHTAQANIAPIPMPDNPRKILVLADAPTTMTVSICHRLQLTVERYNYDRQSIANVCNGNWDLLIIESIFNIQDAIRSLKKIRTAKPAAQIFIVSRQCNDSVIQDSFLHGADDHICIPFSEAVFQAKISAALRRSAVLKRTLEDSDSRAAAANSFVYPIAREDTPHTVDPGPNVSELFQLLPASKKAIVDGISISLTKTELLILSYFISNVNIPCEKFEMLEKVLGYKDECYLTSLYSHINRLRKKLIDENLTTIQIKTIWRYGYKLVIA
ncbi:response regulator transcription factor [Granulosicoccus sp.]|nr:response regulator transcription factor [Granulosicoccus sp.]